MREWNLWAIRIILAFVVTGTVQTVWADRVDLGFGEVDVERAFVAGHPNGIPPDSPANYVDPNVASSPFAGVGSLRIISDNTFICSGTVISPNHVLTAAHCLDLNDDGVVDVTPGDVDFFLNAGSSPSVTIPARKFSIHPDFTGFGNPVVNDDVAVIKLSQPVPLGTPVYPLYVSVPNFTTPITMVGYGRSGNGVDGHTVDPNFHVKRTGRNILDAKSIDDEDSSSIEVFMFDFDGPDATTNIFDVGTPGFDQFVEGTLGNALESTIGGGDSGGPSFVDVGNESLELLGINTFTFSLVGGPAAPLFGSGGGGMLVPPYLNFIQGLIVMPLPAAGWMGLGLLGAIATVRRLGRNV